MDATDKWVKVEIADGLFNISHTGMASTYEVLGALDMAQRLITMEELRHTKPHEAEPEAPPAPKPRRRKTAATVGEDGGRHG